MCDFFHLAKLSRFIFIGGVSVVCSFSVFGVSVVWLCHRLFIHTLVHYWTFGWFPVFLTINDGSCYEHSRLSFGYISRSEIAGSYVDF